MRSNSPLIELIGVKHEENHTNTSCFYKFFREHPKQIVFRKGFLDAKENNNETVSVITYAICVRAH